ncbi:SUMF1/EgtB/PvdO family nonheme iron enzyme [Brunnivagina elsteri]|uniref:Peptidase C14 n=1 Tax=Brunnivagina elsteri CCALA 953 TaxID=987040 RepID=A0A2A2TIT6_9CYAN|nr:SUMF1/EgtB/PvdO family nonheme iron enzyme [Calothrix elsteri]PAX53892.1 peptidase C14 [Calothrix elsteri CCALA 953]
MGKNWAIAIGINNYDNLQPLKYAQRDAEVMATWFEEEAKFDQIFLFTENSPPIPANPPIVTQPTNARFRRFLNRQFETPLLNPEDNLWFFFAGHGKRYNDQDYLMFPDSDPTDSTTAISVDYVTQRLRRCGADNVVLLLDACRDEGSRGGLRIGEEEHQGVITFYSCTANQQSFEIDELQHGAFTHMLLEGLRLQGEFSCATVERLDQYLRYNVPKINSSHKKPPQNPYLKAEPPYKMYFILLKQAARLQDVLLLKYQASQVENKGDLPLAKQLWKRVVVAVGYDSEAFEAIERIARREIQPVTNPNSQPDISITQPVTSSRGDTPNSPPSLRGKGVGGLDSFQFDVVTVNQQGKEVNREKREAEYFREEVGNGVSLDMVYIPAGSFMMGTEDAEIERLVKKFNWDGYRTEKPQHQVTVPTFYMGKHPITQAQWKAVAALPKINREFKPEPSHFKGDNRPVELVSWYDAVEFCARLSKHTGKQYRLPSEAEWEYACRAGTTTPFHFGETITSKLANYDATNTFAEEAKGEYRQQTTPVGEFPANAFGLHDMHGNVWEWCLDDWHADYKGAPKDGNPWFNDKNNNLYQKTGNAVLRGGSWNYTPGSCRSALRLYNTRENRSYNVGFRVVVVPA